jgi:hypothetical protein
MTHLMRLEVRKVGKSNHKRYLEVHENYILLFKVPKLTWTFL